MYVINFCIFLRYTNPSPIKIIESIVAIACLFDVNCSTPPIYVFVDFLTSFPPKYVALLLLLFEILSSTLLPVGDLVLDFIVGVGIVVDVCVCIGVGFLTVVCVVVSSWFIVCFLFASTTSSTAALVVVVKSSDVVVIISSCGCFVSSNVAVVVSGCVV